MFFDRCTKCGDTIAYAYYTGDEYCDLDGDIVGFPIPDEDDYNQPYCWSCAREESDEIREANPYPDDDDDDDDDEADRPRPLPGPYIPGHG